MSVRAIQINNPWFLEQDNEGRPAAGYLVYTLQAGSVSTLLTTYSDPDLTAPNTNPIVLNNLGEAKIFTTAQLKLVYCAPGADLTSPIWTEDYVGAVSTEDLKAAATPTTVNNSYMVTVSPAPTELTDRLELIMTPDVDSLDTLVLLPGQYSTTVFTGTGPNDGVFSGPYTGTTAGSIFTVEIDSVSASGDTFKWKKDGGAWVTNVPIVGNNAIQYLIEGIAITFSTNLNHVLGDVWTVQVMTPVTLNVNNLGTPPNKIVYKNVGGVLQALDGGDLQEGIPATLVYSAVQDCWILNNPSTAAAESPALSSRVRKELYSAYQVVVADAGNTLSCNGSFTITLPTAPAASGKFFYIKNKLAPNGTILIDAQGYKIYGYGVGDGQTSFTLARNLECVQLESNGIDWEILTMVIGPSIPGAGNYYSAGTYYWTAPIGISSINVSNIVGGGGGGAGCNSLIWTDPGGYGGGAGQWLQNNVIPVTPLETYTIIVGNGGANRVDANGYPGGVSQIWHGGTLLLSANGGAGGIYPAPMAPVEGPYVDRSGGVNGSGYGSGGAGQGYPEEGYPVPPPGVGFPGQNGCVVFTY